MLMCLWTQWILVGVYPFLLSMRSNEAVCGLENESGSPLIWHRPPCFSNKAKACSSEISQEISLASAWRMVLYHQTSGITFVCIFFLWPQSKQHRDAPLMRLPPETVHS